MAGAFRIAEAFVEVTADETGYDRSMARLKAKKNTAKISAALDDKDAKAKLTALTKPRTVKIGINLADKAATTSLRNLAKTRTVKLTVKLDDKAATSALTKLTRDRTVKLTARFDDTAASRKLAALSEQHTVGITPSISDAAYNRVKAQLDKLTADRVVNIRASVDTRVGAAEIRNLIQRRQVRIGIDVDTRVAADSLANLTRRRNMTVGVNLNSTDARARLDTLTRDRHITVHADVDRSAADRISSMFAGFSSGALSAAKASITNLMVVAVEALPTLASLGQALISMGPAAALAAPAVLSLGAAFAAIKLGTSGIGDAFKAAFAPAVKSAGQAESATRRVESAQRSLAKAQQAVKDAEVNAAEARVKAARDIQDAQQNLKNTVQDVADSNRRAAESVAGAERDLADAQRAARKAQQDLTDARKQAAQDLEDLNNRLADAQLDQRQKILDLQDAEQNLAAVKAKGAAASAEDLAKAQLQYDQAAQALSEQQTETKRLQQQTADANAAGVEGSKTVKDAKQQEADAQQQVIDKTQALKDAQIEAARAQEDGAQRIAKAQRDVADAQAAAVKAAADGARQIADAQESAKEAAEALAQAQESVGLQTNKVADAMARLSPNARAFVDAVIAQREAWRALKLDVQNTLFAGLGQTFTRMSAAILPSLRQGLTGTASILNTIAKNAANAVTELGKTGTLRQLFAGLNNGLKPLSRIPGQIITGLAQISVAASPAFARLTTAAGSAADRIAKKLGDAFKSGALTEAIDNGITVAKQFGKLLGDVFGTIGNIMKAASAGGGDALGALGSVFAELRKITAMPEVQKALTSIFTAINAIAKLVAGTLGAVIQAALPLLAKLAPVVTELAEKFGPVLAQLADTLGRALTPIIDALLPVVSDIGDIIVGLVQAVMPLLEPIGKLIGAVVTALAPVISALGAQLVPVVAVLAQGLVPVIDALVPIVQMLGGFIAQLAPMFPQLMLAVLPLIPPLSQLAVALLGLALQVIQPLLPLILKLAGLLTTILTGAITTLVPAITMVIGWLTKFVDAVTSVVKWIVDKFTWLYDTLVGHSIIPDLVNAIITWFTSLWTKTKQLFTQLKDWVVKTWNDLWNAARTKWNSFWSGLQGAISGAWSWAKSSFSGLKTSITNTWHGLWNDASSKLSSVISSIKGKISTFSTSMKSAFSHLRDSLGSIWNGIESKISSPVKWVISHVYNSGIRSMWNTIAGKISSKITLPYISLGFSEGGVVPGKPTNKDTVPAMLAPGERVLSNQQVDQLGGQRAIDAMLGQDQPTRTGGNPTQQQERRREQAGAQHFSLGGIVGSITNAIGGTLGSAASWAKDLVIGGLKSAAQKAISSLVRPLIGRIPGGGVGSLMRDMSNKALNGMLGFLGNEDKKAVGGPAVQRALAWAKSQSGLPYQWAGNGNPSWDCSGFMSAIESVIRGERPHRRWATGAFPPGPSGWVRNLQSPFMIGITNAGVGHTAGTLAGVNFESSGGRGVHYGKTARGYNDPLFTSRWGFEPATRYDTGGLLQPGATMAINRTGKPEAVLNPEDRAKFEALIRSGGGITIGDILVNGTFDFSKPSDQKRAAKQLVVAMKEELRQFDRARA